MAEHSYPFESGSGAFVTEDQWSYMASGWQDDGVDVDGPWQTDLKVFSNNEPYTVRVNPGKAYIAGFHYVLDAEATLTIEGNTSSQVRHDLVVLRVDRVNNQVVLAVKQGVPGGSYVTPDRSWAARELPLADLSVPANSTSLIASNVSDWRDFKGKRIRTFVGGFSSHFPVGTVYYNNFNRRFHAIDESANEQVAYRREVGAVPCTSTTRPTNLLDGALIYETDTKRVLVDAPAGWEVVGGETPFTVLQVPSAETIAANSSGVSIPWSQELVDRPTSSHSNSTDPWKYTASQAGWYQLTANVGGSCTATANYIAVNFRKNESINTVDQPGTVKQFANGSPLFFSTTSFMRLVAGDYVRVEVDNTTNQTFAVFQGSLFTIRWVAP
ncbi:hypothetical protein [Nonomuraea zeae]|uniref:hypothetical protein n=1 Tax=Nonomuraea zeae TaxID=1642303 RepID=UPI0036241F23